MSEDLREDTLVLADHINEFNEHLAETEMKDAANELIGIIKKEYHLK